MWNPEAFKNLCKENDYEAIQEATLTSVGNSEK